MVSDCCRRFRFGSHFLPLASLVLVAAHLGFASQAAAQATPAGGQFQVNTYTFASQWTPSVAADAAGRFVVVWNSFGSAGSDTSGYSIQARRYSARGVPLGNDFQVNAYTTDMQMEPAVAMSPAGAFVVVWTSNGSSATDHDTFSVQARRFDADGVPQGAQFQVNTYTTHGQGTPAVAINAAGTFVVAWRSIGSGGTDTSDSSVQARRYSAAGTPLGEQFQVNTYTTDYQDRPAVAVDPIGRFVVAWQSYGSSGTDTGASSIQARRFNAVGVPLGDQFQVNTYTPGAQYDPAVAVTDSGDFLVAWDSYGSSGSDSSGYSIHARRFDSQGAPLGGELQVNTYTTNDQDSPDVAAIAQGGFVVSWTSSGSLATDSSGTSIQGRRYRSNGTTLGSQFQVNVYTTGTQSASEVAVDGAGNFVVAWTSNGSPGNDDFYESIQARRFDALFRDGFETAGTSRWTATVP